MRIANDHLEAGWSHVIYNGEVITAGPMVQFNDNESFIQLNNEIKLFYVLQASTGVFSKRWVVYRLNIAWMIFMS